MTLGYTDDRFWKTTPRTIFHQYFSLEYAKIKKEDSKVARGDEAIRQLKGLFNGR